MRIFILLLSILLPCSFFALKSRIDSIVEILSGQVIVNHFGSLEAEQERQYLGSIHPVEYSWWLKAEEEKLSEFFKSEGYHRIRMGITEADKNFKALEMDMVLQTVKDTWTQISILSELKESGFIRVGHFIKEFESNETLNRLVNLSAELNHKKELIVSGEKIEICLRAALLIYKVLACRARSRDSEYVAERRWLIRNFSAPVLHEVLGFSPLKLLYPTPFFNEVSSAATTYSVSSSLVYAVMKTESGFNPAVVSKAGAVGLMQVMPNTATGLLNKKGIKVSPSELHVPETGIRFGSQYLASVTAMYSDLPKALAAYNAGPTPVKRWQSRPGDFFENIGFFETRNYVLKVLLDYKMYMDLNPNFANAE